MDFHEVLFPDDISYGSAGGPKFKTTIFDADSGYEQRNIDWQNVRCEFDVGQAIKTRTQMDTLRAFFMARRGRAYGFRFKDWGDYTIRNEIIAAGDGVKRTFQITKTYTSDQTQSGEFFSYTRDITKIDWDTVSQVTVNGVAMDEGYDYSINYNTGEITFDVIPPAATFNSAGEIESGEIIIGRADFHVPVRFDTDHLDVTHEFWETMSWPNIAIREVRDWGEALV